MLYGVDDGAKSPNMMMHMIDSAYKSGVRAICMTPHYNPAHFKCPREVIVRHFAAAMKFAAERFPDLELYLGQELYYYNDTLSDIMTGKCFTLNRTRNVLVEFGPYADKAVIIAGISRLLTSGFTPVIAHVERYSSIRRNPEIIREMKRQGVVIQVNAASVLGVYGFMTKHFVFSLIRQGLVDVIADDCHDVVEVERDRKESQAAVDKQMHRGKSATGGVGGLFRSFFAKSPEKKMATAKKFVCLREAYDVIERKFGQDTADMLCSGNPEKIIRGE